MTNEREGKDPDPQAADRSIDLSFIVPCYNEREVIGRTIPPLWEALSAAVPRCELILVDNGSTDGTAEVITQLCGLDPRIRRARVPQNLGYGLGVLTGYEVAQGRCIGHLPADGPVAPEDVAALARRALAEGPGSLVTAVRLQRQDTWVRRVVSQSYNLTFLLLFGPLTADINGTPKFLHAGDLARMRPVSRDYFLEAEMMIKARQMGLRTIPVEVYSRMREGGRSKVSARLLRTCAEFIRNLVRARLGRLGAAAFVLGMLR
jgi:dolichol-phosphate mannosyltransferase